MSPAHTLLTFLFLVFLIAVGSSHAVGQAISAGYIPNHVQVTEVSSVFLIAWCASVVLFLTGLRRKVALSFGPTIFTLAALSGILAVDSSINNIAIASVLGIPIFAAPFATAICAPLPTDSPKQIWINRNFLIAVSVTFFWAMFSLFWYVRRIYDCW